jgi:hypothetical protein
MLQFERQMEQVVPLGAILAGQELMQVTPIWYRPGTQDVQLVWLSQVAHEEGQIVHALLYA